MSSSRRVALRGPIFAGKTTTAEALEHRGFHVINFTDSLKATAAAALSAVGEPTSVQDIKADKERYRGFLQHLGTLIGFDVGATIPAVLAEAFDRYGPDADYVFDNVRFLGQWEQLRYAGFRLVQLTLAPLEQEQRASARGMSHQALGRAMSHPAEVGFPVQPGELLLPGTAPVADNLTVLLAWLAAQAEGQVAA